MHTNITTEEIRVWCRSHRAQMVVGVSAMILSVLTGASTALDGYLLTRLPSSSKSEPIVTQQHPTPMARIPRRMRGVIRRSTIVLHAGPESVTEPIATGGTVFAPDGFPAFVRTVHPVSRIPAWGTMTTPAQWNRTYGEMDPAEFVPVPAYDLGKLMVPLHSLFNPRKDEDLTLKLYYSTRWFSAYDLDAGEFTGNHPGLDLKLPLGTPVSAVAGGKVVSASSSVVLGTHIVIEHRHPRDGTFYSVYGHLGTVSVREGENVEPGQIVGTVGMTGRTSGPHLHLQVDRGEPGETHRPYAPSAIPPRAEADRHSVSPAVFIARYADGE